MKIESILDIVVARAKADISGNRNTALYDLQAADGFTSYAPRRLAYGTDGDPEGVKFVAHLDELDALAQRLNLLLPANPGSMAPTSVAIDSPSTYSAIRTLDTGKLKRLTIRQNTATNVTIRLEGIPTNDVRGYGLVTEGNTLIGQVIDTDSANVQSGTLTVTPTDVTTNLLPSTRSENGVTFTVNEAAPSTPGFVRAITDTSYLAPQSLTKSNIANAVAQISYNDPAEYGTITKQLNFDVDSVESGNLQAPTYNFTSAGILNRFVSGIPSLSSGDTINANVSVEGAYSTHYATPWILRVTPNSSWSNGAEQNFAGLDSISEGGSDSRPVTMVTADNKKATNAGPPEDISSPFSAANTLSVSGISYPSDPSLQRQISTGNLSNPVRRIDTIQFTRPDGQGNTLNESEFRIKANGGADFPDIASPFSDTWNPRVSLKDGIDIISGGPVDANYQNELQAVFGRVVYPRGDYSAFAGALPSLAESNINYNDGLINGAFGARWIAFNCGTISNASEITLRILGAQGNWNNTATSPEQTAGLFLQYRVTNAPPEIDGWINGNKAYANQKRPAINNTNFSSLALDDQGGVVSALKEGTSRILTFGGLVTGTLYIRIGLTSSSGLSFTGISIQ